MSKHQIEPVSINSCSVKNEQNDAGQTETTRAWVLAEPVSPDHIITSEREQGKNQFLCLADHGQDWQPYRLMPNLLCVMSVEGRTFIGPQGYLIRQHPLFELTLGLLMALCRQTLGGELPRYATV